MSGRFGDLPRADVWLHGASVGDVRALRPLWSALSAARPELSAILTVHTTHGRQMARALFPELPVCAAPYDIPPIPTRALRRVAPRLVVLEYLELWPAWIAACHRQGVAAAVVDGHIGPRTLRARRLLRSSARRLSMFGAQTERDAAAARQLGVVPERVAVLGNGKYDGVSTAPPQPSSALRAIIGQVDVVVGSLHPDEEAEVLSALARAGLRAVVAPRYPRRARAILKRARALGISARCRSDGPGEAVKWLVLDSIGELAATYALGHVALVGGTFGRREGQNLVEPAAHGRPIVHGPRVGNVRQEVAVFAGQGAWQTADAETAFAQVHRCLNTPCVDPRPALATLRGATARNVKALLRVLDGGAPFAH